MKLKQSVYLVFQVSKYKHFSHIMVKVDQRLFKTVSQTSGTKMFIFKFKRHQVQISRNKNAFHFTIYFISKDIVIIIYIMNLTYQLSCQFTLLWIILDLRRKPVKGKKTIRIKQNKYSLNLSKLEHVGAS